VSHIISDSEDSEDGYLNLTVEDFGGEDNYEGEFEATTGDEVIIGLQKEWQKKLELEQLAKPTVTEILMHHVGTKGWRKAESIQSLGYNRQSLRCLQEIIKEPRDREAADKKTQNI